MMPDVLVPEQLDLTYLEAVTEAERERQRQIVRARDYHEGDQPTFLSDRLREFLNIQDADEEFPMNVTRIVVTAVAERLVIKALTCGDEDSQAAAAAWWKANRLGAVSADVHEQALVIGEHFVIVDLDSANQPRFTPHPRYTDLDVDDAGGYGVWVDYPDDDPMRPPERAVKRWVEDGEDERGRSVTRTRATVYYPDRVEKYVFAGGWQPLVTEGEPWPLPWKDAAGQPLGIPVIPFSNRGLRPEALDAWPLQDALNKTLIDLLAAADTNGFPIFKAFGFVPTTDGRALESDGSNALNIVPGTIVGSSKPANEATFDVIPAASLAELRALKSDFVMDVAIVTDTPVSRFKISGQVAAEGTLKEQAEPLYAKARIRQELFGAAWEQCFAMARKLANLYGSAGLDETQPYAAAWQPISARSAAEDQADWKAKREAGVPKRQIWLEMGYTQEQIDGFLADPEVRNGTFATYPAP